MKQFKRIIQTEVQERIVDYQSFKKNASVNHNFKIHQWKERKIVLASTVERYSDGNTCHLGPWLPCLLCVPSAQFSPAFLEFAFCPSTVPAWNRDSVNGSSYEHLFDRSLGNRIHIHMKYQDSGLWGQAVGFQFPICF